MIQVAAHKPEGRRPQKDNEGPADKRQKLVAKSEPTLSKNLDGHEPKHAPGGKHEAEKDGRAILRIDGKRYERQLVRIKTGDAIEGVTQEFTRKYGVTMTPEEVEKEELWLFELAPPRTSDSGVIR